MNWDRFIAAWTSRPAGSPSSPEWGMRENFFLLTDWITIE
jgi:hypothetical protein